MPKYSVINLKTDPKLKKLASETAAKLGISLSAVLNNELRRFTIEQSVTFSTPETPNATTARTLKESQAAMEKNDYHSFADNEEALDFLSQELA